MIQPLLRRERGRRFWDGLGVAFGVCLLCSVACSGRATRNPGMGAGGSDVSAGGTGGTGAATSAGQAPGGNVDCQTGEVAAKRVVRLSFNQILGTMEALLGPKLRDRIDTSESLAFGSRTIPPLASPSEGAAYNEPTLELLDGLAEKAGEHVRESFADVTGCKAADEGCAREFLAKLAERAFRRPLTGEELERLQARHDTFRALDATVTVEVAVQYGVYAIFHSPQFLYRTEFGDNAQGGGRLTSAEAASLLSYLLTDAPPDEELLTASAKGELTDGAMLGAQAKRLLQAPATQQLLASVVSSHLGYFNLDSVVIDDVAFTRQLRSSMKGEATRFLERTLRQGKLQDFVLGRTAYADAALAPLYGITAFPPPGMSLDAEGFVELPLPAGRVGILTQPAFLAARARPEETSVVGRGLAVRSAFIGGEVESPPPADPQELEALLKDVEPGATARRFAQARAEAESCADCHDRFDAYGVALETFDPLGRYRTVDPEGRPIDPSFPLPEELGGGTAADIVAVAERIAATGAVPRRFAQVMAIYALAPAGIWPIQESAFDLRGCLVSRLAERLDPKSATFSDLVEALVTDPAFLERTAP